MLYILSWKNSSGIYPFEHWKLAVKWLTNVEYPVISVFQYAKVFVVTTACNKSKTLELR